jgi:hypothetical protein
MCNQMYGHGNCSLGGMRPLLALCFLCAAGAVHADKASIERYFEALDLNGDGYVSLAEAAGDPVVVSRFDKGDRDKDGKLSAKEFANLSKVKLRVARAKKKGEEPSAAVGGSAPEQRPVSRAERRRVRMMKGEGAEGG